MIKLRCPKCLQKVSADESLFGQSRPCPECGTNIPIPLPATDRVICESLEELADVFWKTLIHNDYRVLTEFLVLSLTGATRMIEQLPPDKRPDLNPAEIVSAHFSNRVDLEHDWTGLRKAVCDAGIDLIGLSLSSVEILPVEDEEAYVGLERKAVDLRVIDEWGAIYSILLTECVAIDGLWVISERIEWRGAV
ncbi:MAG: hypothetical protein AAF514_05595 [Verrucomicrobiota bacterium]